MKPQLTPEKVPIDFERFIAWWNGPYRMRAAIFDEERCPVHGPICPGDHVYHLKQGVQTYLLRHPDSYLIVWDLRDRLIADNAHLSDAFEKLKYIEFWSYRVPLSAIADCLGLADTIIEDPDSLGLELVDDAYVMAEFCQGSLIGRDEKHDDLDEVRAILKAGQPDPYTHKACMMAIDRLIEEAGISHLIDHENVTVLAKDHRGVFLTESISSLHEFDEQVTEFRKELDTFDGWGRG